MQKLEIIQEIKEKNEITAVISEYVTLRKAGRSWIGLCPFHSEKTPSFNVNQAKQFFYCFGCGAGGDVISFLMKVENLDFIDAARRLADRAGIPWPDTDFDNEEFRKKDELYKVNKLAATFYHQILSKTETGISARNYLQKRGISQETWNKFLLGFAPVGWHHLTEVIRKKGVSLEAAETLGLISFGENGYYDRFRERIIFPIFDPKGNICGFGGRVLDNSQPKYLNSPDTVLFHKSQTLYGLNFAKEAVRKTGQAIIMEGYLDVIQAHQSGFNNTVASLGTALTAEQAKLIKRYASEVVLAYDSDVAGQNATIKGMEILQDNGLNVRVLSMPTGDDPDSFIKNHGREAFEELIQKAAELIDFKINLVLKRHNLYSPDGKAGAIQEILPHLSAIQNVVAREEYIRKVSRETGVSETAIWEELRYWMGQNRKNTYFTDRTNNNSHTIEKNQNRHSIGSVAVDQLSPLYKALFEAEKELLQSALQEYDKFERIKEELKPEELYFEVWRELYKEMLTQNSTPEILLSLEEITESLREVAATLLAECQVKEGCQVDVEGVLNKIKMLRLQEQIQHLTVKISTGKDESGEALNEIEMMNCIKEFTELKKKLQKEFPNFVAEY